MKTSLLNLVLLALLVTTSCKKKKETNGAAPEEVQKNLVKQDIIVEYTPIYLSPKAKPIIIKWTEYIGVQNKVYELKNTNTVRLKKQLNELEILMVKLIDSEYPKQLETHLFERKLDLLSESVTELKFSLERKPMTIDYIKRGIFKILIDFKASKNQINAIYGG